MTTTPVASVPPRRGRGRPPAPSEAREAARLGRRIATARTALDAAMDEAAEWARTHPDIAETTLSATIGVDRVTLRKWKASRPGQGAGGGRPRKDKTARKGAEQ